MAAYYNEIDAFAAQWLRNLIAAGHIAPGEVDERSITDVQPDDLRGFDQCHFFAGIGGWSYALRLAGWPDDRPVWTGSCPCQPFSAAGFQRGSDDERHLWPSWFRLIRERLPSTIFGEQVAGSAGLAWLDHVLADVEGEGYAAAAADLPACGVGAPHIRQRIFWMADRCEVGRSSETPIKELDRQRPGFNGVACPWRDCEWIQCADGSARPIEPGVHAVANGIPPGMGRVCGYGNAIVPQVAAEFIAAYMECRP